MVTNHKDRLDQWLDSALRQYGNVQPRAGLEDRILTNLAVRNCASTRQRWTLSLASLAAVAAIALLVWVEGRGLYRYRQSSTTLPQRQTASATHNSPSVRPLIAQGPLAPHNQISHRHGKSGPSGYETAHASPRLRQFPSQRSLSEQEQLLVTYVRRFPGEAVEVAREQTERERELEALYSNSTAKSNFDQER
jgi:hypothetical protein